MYKTIEVEFCEEQIEVIVELFNYDEEPTFSVKSAVFKGVDILHFIERLGGYTELVSVVEKKLKEENCDD